MAFIICSDCKNEISDKELKCPKCGSTIGKRGAGIRKVFKNRKVVKKRYFIYFLVPIVIIIIVVFLFELVLFNQNFEFFK